jgi:hypothetical protein
MNIEGRCHCGKISFEAEVDPGALNVCHCSDCQSLSGSAFRASIPAAASRFVLHGVPKTYVKTADGGALRVQAFCDDCGSPIYSSAVDKPESYSLRIGLIAQRASLTPKRQIWRSSALPWIDELADIPSSPME